MEERKPIHEKIFEDVVNEFAAKENQSYHSIQVEIASEYRRRVKAYLGEDTPCYTDEGQYVTAEAKAKREAFKKKLQAQGKLPKKDKSL
jgi:hypothetical protein